MCDPATLTALGISSAASATAAGATAAAATGAAAGSAWTLGSVLQTAGLVASVGGSIYQGVQGYQAAKQNAEAIAQQRDQQQVLTATEDRRARQQFRTQIHQQAADLAGRGIQLDSPTAILLGQTAAQEMSYQSQSIRSGGAATDQQLTNEQKAYNAKATSSLLNGTFSAASSFLSKAPDIWPSLKGSSGTASGGSIPKGSLS